MKSENHGNLSVNSKHFSLALENKVIMFSKTFFCSCKQYPGNSKIDFQNVTSASTLKICTSPHKCGLFLESVLHHFLKLEQLLG